VLDNRSMPTQLLIPVLVYENVGDAVVNLCEAFGFSERWRIGEHRAQLGVGHLAAIAITQGKPSIDGADHVMVRVEDVDGHCNHARLSGAQIVSEPADMPYGERQYTARDFSGRLWVFTQTVADVAPEDWGGTTPNHIE
jgi:uncharacterized glyoxalase superfamily protein PhnB